jgi:hypothetical protein
LEEDTHETRGALANGRSGREDPDSAAALERPANADALTQLTATLRELEPETALKIRTLMIAGRDGQSIASVNVNLSLCDAEAGFAFMAADSGENGPLLVEYLRRGHAIARAIGIDLDRPLVEWQSPSSESLEERAWLSFGKQLASSDPRDWHSFAVVESPTGVLTKLYLRLGDRAWWSFQGWLDRPTRAGMEKERRALGRRHFKGVPIDTLDALVARLERHGSVQGRALRRANRAIRARVGWTGEAAEG